MPPRDFLKQEQYSFLFCGDGKNLKKKIRLSPRKKVGHVTASHSGALERWRHDVLGSSG